ncbi:MAG: hypothetical protein AAB250_18365, partial [Bdellovibrionota bacterium]
MDWSITEHGVQKTLRNTCTKDIFVPTKTAAEWLSFRNGAPAGVTQTTGDPCAVTPIAGMLCADGLIYAGSLTGGMKYKTTPGNCSNSSTPTCDFVNDDSLTKQYSTAGTTIGSNSWSDGVSNTAAIVAAFPAVGTQAQEVSVTS